MGNTSKKYVYYILSYKTKGRFKEHLNNLIILNLGTKFGKDKIKTSCQRKQNINVSHKIQRWEIVTRIYTCKEMILRNLTFYKLNFCQNDQEYGNKLVFSGYFVKKTLSVIWAENNWSFYREKKPSDSSCTFCISTIL